MDNSNQLRNFIKGRRLTDFENTLEKSQPENLTLTLHDCINTNNPNFPSDAHAIMTSLLIRKGLDVNAKDAKGNTPLLIVAQNCHNASSIYAVMGIELIKAGADVNALDATGKSALFHCFKANVQPLLIQTLLDNGADVNLRVPNNGEFVSPVPEVSLLGWAYWNGKSFFDRLVAKGATMTNAEVDYLNSVGRPLKP